MKYTESLTLKHTSPQVFRNTSVDKGFPNLLGQHIPTGTKPTHEGIFLGELMFARMHAGPVFTLARIQKIFSRTHFPKISHILEGTHVGANTCRACIRTRANTGKIPGEFFMYWFRAEG